MAATSSEIPEVDPEEAAALVEEGAFLLDVREPDEWAAGRAQGAVHIPMGSLNERQEELPDDRRIVAVCRSGGRSGQVTAALNRAGYDAVNLAGGTQAWHAAGLPMDADRDDPTVI